jgi:hypothetical protein
LAGHIGHEWLALSENQFDNIAQAIEMFWKEFPERLFLKK